MIRRAFTMRLKPDSLAEYKHHHDNIWPELVAEIERSGIASITTFQRDLELFLISEIADEAAWDKLWNSEVHRRWAEVMQPLMHLREDGIVDAGELSEVFHLTTGDNGQASLPAASSAATDDLFAVTVATIESALEPGARASAKPRKKTRRKAKQPIAAKTTKKKQPAKKARPKKAAKSRAVKAAKKKAAPKKAAPKKAKKVAKKKTAKKKR